jgi:hypothetical protein
VLEVAGKSLVRPILRVVRKVPGHITILVGSGGATDDLKIRRLLQKTTF